MEKIEGTSVEKRKCVHCHHKTAFYIEYRLKEGPAIRIPVCPNCKEQVTFYLYEPMKAALSGIQAAIWASTVGGYCDKCLREERSEY